MLTSYGLLPRLHDGERERRFKPYPPAPQKRPEYGGRACCVTFVVRSWCRELVGDDDGRHGGDA